MWGALATHALMNEFSPSPSAAARTRYGGLDGLRAIAVALVLVYHFFPAALPGGFLGVDIFFVISGFLITSLLIREHQLNDRIALGAFWRRRARRLLPALALVLLVCSSLALIIGGDVLLGIGAQIFGSVFFISNWVFIGRGTDYFAHDNPELFRNTWSLAIEEQFYLVLPLLVLIALAVSSRLWRAMPFIALSLGSAALMVALAAAGADPTRVYFGSDSHTFGLFAGVTLAFLTSRAGTGSDAGPRLRPPAQWLTLGATLVGLGVLGWLAFTLREGSPESFAWGFQLATAAALLVIWAITRPGAWAGIALDIAPLRWVGERSYGIYLWHWPLIVLLAAAPLPWRHQPGLSWLTGALATLLTLLLAALSFRYLEQPVRRLGLRRALGLILRPGRIASRRRPLAIALASVLALTAPATAVAVAVAPTQSSAELAVERGRAALKAQQDAARQRPPAPPPAPEPEPEPVVGDDIWAVGDSVMLASSAELMAALPGISIDADVSRSFTYGVGMVTEEATAGLRPVLVLGLATNGPVSQEDLDTLLATAGDCRLVLINAHGDRWWIPEVNQTLTDFADAYRGIVLADWDSAIAPSPWALAEDGIHPGDEGALIYAQAVQQALVALNEPAERMRPGASPRR